MEIHKTGEAFDVIVVGSGATGGVAAKTLCEKGLKVLVLELGPERRQFGNPLTNMARSVFSHFVTRHQKHQERHGGYWEMNPSHYSDDKKNPYTTPEKRPYVWIRGHQVGGRSLTWGGVTLRLSDFEFKAASQDGFGHDWPIGIQDLAPYYDDLEKFFNVYGTQEGLEQLPDGNFVAAGKLTPAETALKTKVEARWKDRKVIVSRGIHSRRTPNKGEKWPKLSSPGTSLAAAFATGNLTLRPLSAVSRLLMDPKTGKVTGVEFIDAKTKTTHEVKAKAIVLCASTLESLRILMNSPTAQLPDGVGSSSGLLGKGLMDHMVTLAYFAMPDVHDDGKGGHELLGSESVLIPRFQNLGPKQTAPFKRGYGVWGGISRMPVPGFARKRPGQAFGFLIGMGETLPHPENQMTLNRDVKDWLGLPVPHLDCEWRENERVLAQHMQAEIDTMIAEAGGQRARITDLIRLPFFSRFMNGLEDQWKVSPPGLFVHEVGGAPMGDNPKTSVTDPFNRVWDAPNVLVTDGACWPSSGWQNPTLTEMAVTARACDQLAKDFRAGTI